MNGPPRIPWSFYLALAVFLACCGVASYMLGWAFVLHLVTRSHTG